MNIKTTKDIMLRCGDIKKNPDNKKWVSVNDIKKELKKIVFDITGERKLKDIINKLK